jgi:hypothetical protein
VDLLNKKMLLAPILAIALALSLFGATYYFPQTGQATQSSTIPQATPIPTPFPSTASPGFAAVPAPTSTAVPASVTGESSNLIPLLSVVSAIVIAVIAVLLLFSERDRKLER